jgi:hypothetical protein
MWSYRVLGFLIPERSPPLLPDVIRDARRLRQFDPFSLRQALHEPTQFSMVVHNRPWKEAGKILLELVSCFTPSDSLLGRPIIWIKCEP